MVGNTTTTTASATTTTLPNPFATPEQITEKITNELRRIIGEAGIIQLKTETLR